MIEKSIKEVKTKNELLESYKIRKLVFIDEQNISFQDEFDLLDDEYDVYLYYVNNIATSTLRCKKIDSYLKVGRVATLAPYRRQGQASELMKKMIEIAKIKNCDYIYVEAQISATSFYESLGYTAYGEVFLDANIPHKKMILNIKNISS